MWAMVNIIRYVLPSYLHSHHDAGRNTGITVSEHNSRVSGYEIGVVKGKEIAQEVCFISLLSVQLGQLQAQLIVLITMAESIFQEHHTHNSDAILNL